MTEATGKRARKRLPESKGRQVLSAKPTVPQGSGGESAPTQLADELTEGVASQQHPSKALTRAGAGLVFSATLSDERIREALSCKSRTERTEWLMDLLAHDGYTHRRTDRELALLWDMLPSSVGDLVGDARRLIAIELGPDRQEELRNALLAKIQRIGEVALNRRREVVDVRGEVHSVADPDCRTALQAVVETANLLSVRTLAHKHTHEVTSMTEDQIISALKEHGYELTKAPATVETTGEEKPNG